MQECICAWRVRQGERADLSQSDGGNDPTSADLIWWGTSDLVMLPSATCAPFKFPAAVSRDSWREIGSRWGDDGVIQVCVFVKCLFVVRLVVVFA